MATTSKKLTLEQFLTLPEEEAPLEYEEGRIIQKVSPKGEQSKLQPAFARLFDEFAEPSGLARAFTELGFTHGGRSYVPDVSVYLWDRSASPRSPTGTRDSGFRSRRRCSSHRPVLKAGPCPGAGPGLRAVVLPHRIACDV